MPALTVELIRQGQYWLCETTSHVMGKDEESGRTITRVYPPRLWARSETPQSALAYAKVVAAGESIHAADELQHEYFEAVIVALNRVEFVTGPDPRD